MAKTLFFAGDKLLTNVSLVKGGLGTKAADFDGYVEGVEPVFTPGEGWGPRVLADRMVRYKSNPSRHACDARCMNATGRTMNCECSCGGRNHGRGHAVAFMCEET